MKLSLLLTTLFVAVIGCSEKEEKKDLKQIGPSQFIVNGEKVDAEDLIAKSTVNLYLSYKDKHKVDRFDNFCTGVLIDEKHVLTAAHCIVDVAQELKMSIEQLAQNYKVAFGTKIVKALTDKEVIFREIEILIPHEKYTTDSINFADIEPMQDIAIIKLKEAAPEGYIFVKMEQNKDAIQKDLEIVLAGFGLLKSTSWVPTFATDLMKVTVKVDVPQFTESQFTYLAVDLKGSCSGDSGGPAYTVAEDGTLTVVGITSWGDNYCREMGAYTSVPYFYDWIQEKMKSI